jgi:hypothetical protein
MRQLAERYVRLAGVDRKTIRKYIAPGSLRNAGTHRLAHATTGEPTGPTQDTFSTVNMHELQTAVIEALQVSRAAYLYFVDLINSQLSASEGAADTCRLPNQQ